MRYTETQSYGTQVGNDKCLNECYKITKESLNLKVIFFQQTIENLKLYVEMDMKEINNNINYLST